MWCAWKGAPVLSRALNPHPPPELDSRVVQPTRGATATGPGVAHPPAICQNGGGGGGYWQYGRRGGGVPMGLLDQHAIPSLQQLLKVKCCHGVSLGCTKGAEQGPNTWYPLQREQNKDQTHSTPFNKHAKNCSSTPLAPWPPHRYLSELEGGGSHTRTRRGHPPPPPGAARWPGREGCPGPRAFSCMRPCSNPTRPNPTPPQPHSTPPHPTPPHPNPTPPHSTPPHPTPPLELSFHRSTWVLRPPPPPKENLKQKENLVP